MCIENIAPGIRWLIDNSNKKVTVYPWMENINVSVQEGQDVLEEMDAYIMCARMKLRRIVKL